ncbi:hypothetical protein [Streptomyces sp. CRN 30]|uniref:hypothetical protein n=1 Tax=Streptomyces sp. CRN 30 TaxID=3075613 RepID=UPI002A8401F2|nr:hypothetical protein [Streptomyces sp. CRN 30]
MARFVRWLLLLVIIGTGYGVATVTWRVVLGKSWDDSLSAALTLTVSVVGGQWIVAVIQRRTGRGRG